MKRCPLPLLSSVIVALTVAVAPIVSIGQNVALGNLEGLRLHNVSAEVSVHDNRSALHVTDTGNEGVGEDKLVIIDGLQFRDGIIELSLAGSPGSSAVAAARGFVGVAFRISEDTSAFESFYLRPTNGRADDQLRRNHSAQYFSFPDYPWRRLREETPGVYEAYVDLVPGEWTDVKIEVSGNRARLYVHGSAQPSLIINDLKLGNSAGAIGLWIGPGTDAYFSDLKVTVP
jgi:hypothetical protein